MSDRRERLRQSTGSEEGRAGKSSVAIALAERCRLERYNYDWHAHATTPRGHRHLCGAFRDGASDLIALAADRAIVADGFGLLPELVQHVIESPRHLMWLLPTPAFRVVALERRGWTTIDGTSNRGRARKNRLARDALMTDHIRAYAAALGLASLDVDGSRSLADLTAAVERQRATPPWIRRELTALHLTAAGVCQRRRETNGRCAVERSLFDRLGGKSAIVSVVEDFVARAAGDSRINSKFARTDIPRLKAMLIDQVCEASGGPCRYTGRDMKTTHTAMGVTTGEFNALVEDLVATLSKFGVGKKEQDELLGVLAPMKSEIVEVDSSKTGTPLPQSYQPAPALAKSGG